MNKARPQTPLDAIKFICKDLWILLFKKQIDNLKTNHRGIFVLTDSRFQPMGRMSVDRKVGPKATEEALRKAQAVSAICSFLIGEGKHWNECGCGCGWTCGLTSWQFLYFPCGVIRGALSAFGVEVIVHADTTEFPVATFQIKTKGSKP